MSSLKKQEQNNSIISFTILFEIIFLITIYVFEKNHN